MKNEIPLLKNQASILAVGTELTSGQITNRNAAWLSEKLVNIGVDVTLHETVPDDRALIRAALDRCLSAGRLVFVTGGLGPTTDDFTRDVIADWLDKPMEFHEPSWKHIQDRLGRLGVPVAESNRRQCYFPEGAVVLPNSQGTANGFSFQFRETRFWILPGPPREIESIWESGIEEEIRRLLPESKPLRLFTWQCIGKSEAELGEITEAALQDSGLAIGYRAHRPYVEIKVWCRQEELEKAAGWLAKLEKAIAPWIITRQGEDLAVQLLHQIMRSEETEIIDSASGGILAERLGSHLREPAFRELSGTVTLVTEWSSPDLPEQWVSSLLREADPEALTLVTAGFSSKGEWAIGLREGLVLKTETLKSPYVSRELIDRTRRYAVEMTIKKWLEWLDLSLQ